MRHFQVMARTSQGRAAVFAIALSPVFASGCIVAEAPDYGPSQRTPIYLSEPHPTPSNLQILTNTTTPMGIAFGVTVRSEDAGEDIVSVMYIDYKHGPVRQSILDKHHHPASTFDNPRPITYPATVSDFAGHDGVCHSLTLMVMHESGWSEDEDVPIGSPSDLATMTWFTSVNDMGSPLSSCPMTATEIRP
jgi:hypothetical protein